MSADWWNSVQIALRRSSGRGSALSGDAPRPVQRGGWAAAAASLALLALLRVPLGGRAPLDVAALHGIDAAIARLPFFALQAVAVNGDLPQLAIALAAVALWFRRPLNRRFQARIVIALLSFVPTYAIARVVQRLDHRGSFPSDHAALLAIATVVAFTVGRRAGLVALVLSAYVCLFRVASGHDWPSDIAGGAFVGLAVLLVLLRFRGLSRALVDRVFAFIDHRPGIAAALGTVLVTELADGFRYLRLFASSVLHVRLFP